MKFFLSDRICLFLTGKGYIKKQLLSDFKLGNRGRIGMRGLILRKDDVIKDSIVCGLEDYLLFFTNKGRVYKKKVSDLDSEKSKINLEKLLFLKPEEERVLIMISISEADYKDGMYLFFATQLGITKKVRINDFKKVNSNGKIAINLKEGDSLKFVIKTQDDKDVFIASSSGHVVRTKVSNFRVLSRVAVGVFGIKIKKEEEVVSASSSLEGDYLLSVSENGIGKITSLSEFRVLPRSKRLGVRSQRITNRSGKLLASVVVSKKDEILLRSKTNKIGRFEIEKIKESSRNTLGVIIMKLKTGDKLVGCFKNTVNHESFN